MSNSSVTSRDNLRGQSPDSLLGRSPDSYLQSLPSFWADAATVNYEHAYGYTEDKRPSDISDMDSLKSAVLAVPSYQVISTILGANMKLREQGFTMLIQMCGKRRQWERAEQVFQALCSYPNLVPNTYSYSALISALSQGGQQKLALHYFDQQIQSSKLDCNCLPNQHTYSSAITACERAGLPEKAFEIYERMLDDGIKPDHVTYSAILSCCQKNNFWDEASEIIDTMESLGTPPSLGQYHTQIRQYSYESAWEQALDLFLSMQQSGQSPTVVTCQAVLYAFQRGGNAHYALVLLDQMLDNKYEVDITCFNYVLHTLSMYGFWEDARILYQKLKVNGLVPNVQTAKYIVGAHLKGNRDKSMSDGWIVKVQEEFDQLGLAITLDETEDMENVGELDGISQTGDEFVDYVPPAQQLCPTKFQRDLQSNDNQFISQDGLF
eukprot:TRINITY_DN5713_c0_g1_i1.p1 TRINITY_DN5713_c0_g1~~TRINITY_DN5713_c0_g1_i1.p1  ORF type:complete len:437 (+),score=25.78 TRINITY_DN5713_c0_g1_i1:245-1555(+)